MIRFLPFTFFLILSLNSYSQSFWKIENEYGDEILLTIVLNDVNKTFEAFTRKDALKDIAGSFTYSMAKTAGKLKYPEIVHIEGSAQTKNDTLILKGIFTYFDKQYSFGASINNSRFKGKYTDTRNRSHLLTGIKVADNKPIKNYTAIINAAFSLTEKNLLNLDWLKSSEWQNFKNKINELKPKISDDYELAASFVWLGKKLPFSPYEISKIDPRKRLNVRKNIATVREVKFNTAMLDANTLPVTGKELDSISVIIEKKGYSNLIIDLRGNNRLNPGSANNLISYLSDKKFIAGVYLTRKWFESNKMIPISQDYYKLFKDFSNDDFIDGELYMEPGRYLKIMPRQNTFRGKVYVLTDTKTSKVFEALIYILKKEKIATIVGQKTAGVLMLSENLLINNEFDLILPVSEYYTGEGKNLGKSGIEPDINITGDDALKYVLKIL